MSQAIVTRFLGPTNTKGARLSASCDAKRIVVPWPYEKNATDAHCHAAHELASALGWRGVWVGGSLPSKHKDGFVFVNVDKSDDVLEVRA